MGDNRNGRGPPPPSESSYSDYLYSIYRDSIVNGRGPTITTHASDLERQAYNAMRAGCDLREEGRPGTDPDAPNRCHVFGYIAGGAGVGYTMANNRRALDDWGIIPRMMRPAYPTDLRTKLFGHTYASPVIMAPVGVQGAYHPDRELGTAAACAALDVPFCLSTASSSTLEEVAEVVKDESTGNAGAWFQLYWPVDDEITASLLRRARKAGYRVLVVTVDTFTISWRPGDLNAGYLPFITGEGNAIGFSDPEFRRKFAEGGADDDDEKRTPESNVLEASMEWTGRVFPRRARSWSDLRWLRDTWGDGPILVKGVMHPRDALLAREYGADGVVVSNHGGRQVDGAVGALEMLPDVVAAVREKEASQGNTARPFTILFDSGIRTGADIIKALCLGAQAVLVGRPVVYGLGIAGREGAQHVLACMLADFEQTMNLIGAASVADLGQHMLRRLGGVFKSTL